MEKIDVINIGQNVFNIEAKSIAALSNTIDHSFESAVDRIVNCKGRIIVTGMGKSGHIGRKIAATLASTGTPSFFVHPGEASHGDLGMITQNDVLIAISYSGESTEIVTILPLLKRFGIPLIGLSSNSASTLAKNADIHLNIHVEQEACPLGLAPTSSTTACLVMGDALAVATLQCRGFTAKDFALSHPGGALGKRLLYRVADLMHTGDAIPLVNIKASLDDALIEMTKKALGVTGVIDDHNKLHGIFTDGDIRRTIGNVSDIHNTGIKEVMTTMGKTISADMLAAAALKTMENNQITTLFVTNDQQHPIGLIHLHDILRSGIA
jgi:arabinose-5-phosphate isomerase